MNFNENSRVKIPVILHLMRLGKYGFFVQERRTVSPTPYNRASVR